MTSEPRTETWNHVVFQASNFLPVENYASSRTTATHDSHIAHSALVDFEVLLHFEFPVHTSDPCFFRWEVTVTDVGTDNSHSIEKNTHFFAEMFCCVKWHLRSQVASVWVHARVAEIHLQESPLVEVRAHASHAPARLERQECSSNALVEKIGKYVSSLHQLLFSFCR